ncbi:hypothetical protein AVEN_38972-1 [Araneus ventricosus]|uniref:Uncharacterized protein n=1 Tax=Araneus ventricosus TaxID=182803 RepID=A0A4Y2II06_ARAVE|nr:hypothetical protein AVEN_38972-1 [Araneus ventricosus]
MGLDYIKSAVADQTFSEPHHPSWKFGEEERDLDLVFCPFQAFITRLARGHLICLAYSEGNKICPKCQQHQASPKHILDCLGLNWEAIYSSPLLVIDFIKVNGFLDMV